MANQLIVNVTMGETRIARLENSVVAELYIARTRGESGILGNIYKGKVVRVLPGMQAAFVDIGLERTGFLHVSDALPSSAFEGGSFPPALADDDEAEGEGTEAGGEGEAEGGETAEGTGRPRGQRRRRTPRDVQIQDVIKEGQEILVQVIKEAIGTKGARLTSYFSLPGRYLVYMPTVDQVGVSRRLGDDKERRRLRDLIHKYKPKGSGFIVRTAAEGVSAREIKSDIQYLMKIGEEIDGRASQAKAPALVHAELDVILRVVRDLFTEDVDRLIIDSEAEHQRIRDFVDTFMPRLKEHVEFYTDAEPIFDHFAIEVEINRAMGQKVWLKSGGYIIVEQTEALTAIDVNTGRFVGRRNVEDTILKTNLEAVREIVYQLRLRNIGGIIILDFIDMEKAANRNKVYQALKDALRHDRAKTTITKISELGLVEMTRKRTREDLRRLLGIPCPYCEGKGFLKGAPTVCYEIFREIAREALQSKEKQLTVLASPSVANLLFDEERAALEHLEKRIAKRIHVTAVPEFHLEQFEVSDTAR